MFKVKNVKKVKIASALVILFAAVMSPLVAWGGTAATVITLNADVAAIVEWDAATYTILAAAWSGSGVFDTRSHAAMTVSKNILLWTNVDVTINPSGTHSGVLTNHTGGSTDTLTTSYSLTNAAVTPVDVGYQTAATFITPRTYTLTHATTVGLYTLVFGAEMTFDNWVTTLPDKGAYSCEITLTAAWS